MVTFTCAPFLSLTSQPLSSVSVFSIRTAPSRLGVSSNEICAFSSPLGSEDGMILSTVPGMEMLGRSWIRVGSSFSSVIRADLAMRGFAISIMTLARVALLSSFLPRLCFMHSLSSQNGSHAVSFRTVVNPVRIFVSSFAKSRLSATECSDLTSCYSCKLSMMKVRGAQTLEGAC
jgi:hypothetical protein